MRLITHPETFVMNMGPDDVAFFRNELAEGRLDADGAGTSGLLGHRLLHIAATFGKTEAARALLDYGVDPNRAGNRGRLALHLAAGTTELMALLIERGANVFAEEPAGADYGGDTGPTALHRAVRDGNVASCRLLVEKGLSPSYVPEVAAADYLTPMQSAVSIGRREIVTFFVLSCGEDPWQVTRDGRTMDEVEPTHLGGQSIIQEVRLAVSSHDAIIDAIDGQGGEQMPGSRVSEPL